MEPTDDAGDDRPSKSQVKREMQALQELGEQLGALGALEAFASHFGPDFYRLPRNTDSITLRQEQWQVPEQLPLGRDFLTPLRAGEGMSWRVLDRGI